MRLRVQPTHYVYLVLHLCLVLVGFWLAADEGAIRQAVGSSLVAAGITGWVIFLYIYLGDDLRDRLNIVYDAGVTALYASRGSPIRAEYDRRLTAAGQQIDILGFGQATLRQDYASQFASWKSRAKVRVLLIDPDFPSRQSSLASQRDLEEGESIGNTARDVEAFIRQTAILRDQRFRSRYYRCLPTVSIFRVDDEILWGPYLARRVSRNSPTIVVRRGGTLFASLQSHFDEIWESDDLSCEAPLEL